MINFDLSRVRYSKYDKRRSIRIPRIPSKTLAEEIAIHLGDGYLYYNRRNKSYRYGIGLNPIKEKVYADRVAKLLEKLYGYAPKPRNARIELELLAIGTFKRYALRFPIGRRKGNEPLPQIKWILRNEEYMQGFVRGLVDTEGSIKKLSRTIGLVVKMRNYNIVEFYNQCLLYLGYKPRIYQWYEKGKPIYASVLTGKENVLSFIQLIQPRNPYRLIQLSRLIRI